MRANIIQFINLNQMKGSGQYTLSFRREMLIKSIKNEQKKQLFQQKRRSMLVAHTAYRSICQIRQNVENFNIIYNQLELANVLEIIQQSIKDQEFMIELKKSSLIDWLIDLIIKQNHKKPHIKIPKLFSDLIHLIYSLSIRNRYFFRLVQQNLHLILFGLYRYPENIEILHKVAQIMTLKQMGYLQISNNVSKSLDNYSEVSHLLDIYILRDSYSFNNGTYFVQKGTKQWFHNATKTVEISFALMLLTNQAEMYKKESLINQALIEGLKVSLNNRIFWAQTYNIETNEIQTQSQPMEFQENIQISQQIPYQQNGIYFISVILDIILIIDEVINLEKLQIFCSLLQQFLDQKYYTPIIKQTIFKILKVLHKQLVLQSDDLQKLSLRYPCLSQTIDQVANSDI